nr:hypothetical protein [Thermoleophilaceae bacterium]
MAEEQTGSSGNGGGVATEKGNRAQPAEPAASQKDSLSVTDNRTGETFEVEI